MRMMPRRLLVRVAALSVMLAALLGLNVLLADDVAAAPCCQTCPGWAEGEPEPGPCWETCIVCSSGGNECGIPGSPGCAPWMSCCGGWCTYQGPC